MKKIGLYFGTFNPIHVGHLIIANYMANSGVLDEVWFVVSPHNPHKDKNNLLADHHRLAMVQRAVENNVKLKASNIEFDLPKPSYTVLTLQALREKYPTYSFSLIMGQDNLRTLHKWRNFEYIIDNFEIYVYPRVILNSEDLAEKNDFAQRKNVHFCDAPVMNVSSTFIRNLIKEKKDARYLLTEPVFNYVDEMNFFK